MRGYSPCEGKIPHRDPSAMTILILLQKSLCARMSLRPFSQEVDRLRCFGRSLDISLKRGTYTESENARHKLIHPLTEQFTFRSTIPTKVDPKVDPKIENSSRRHEGSTSCSHSQLATTKLYRSRNQRTIVAHRQLRIPYFELGCTGRKTLGTAGDPPCSRPR
jgi:hypothetical protein